MSRFQAGALVVYGNLGVHEVEGIGLRHFCDEPAREYYTLRPYFSDSHDRSYIPTAKEGVLRPVTPAQQAAADLARIKAETLPIPTGIQTALAEHYQALLHTNDFYQYLTLFKELGQKQTQQQSRGRKINAMDTYFYQMVERVLREELAVSLGESQQEAGKRLLGVLNSSCMMIFTNKCEGSFCEGSPLHLFFAFFIIRIGRCNVVICSDI